MYVAHIVEWSINDFKKKDYETHYIDVYKSLRSNNSKVSFTTIKETLNDISKKREKLEEKINLLKIYSTISDISLFNWAATLTKPKKVSDKSLDINLVVGERINISTFPIECITNKETKLFNIKQERYMLIVKAQCLN